MITVRSKQELEKAMKQETSEIKVVGPYDTSLAKKVEKKKILSKKAVGGTILAGLFGIGCLVAAPFTAGASLLGEGLVASAIGAGAIGLTIGTITHGAGHPVRTALAALALKLGNHLQSTCVYEKHVWYFRDLIPKFDLDKI